MTLRDFLRLTRRRLGTIIACLLVGILVAAGLFMLRPTTYTSQATAYVRVSIPGSSNASADSNAYFNASQLAAQKVKAFVPIFTSEPVAQKVIDQLHLSESPAELVSGLSASNATNSLTIDVAATGSSPEQSQQIADAVVTQSAAQVRQLEGAASPIQVVLMAPANLSQVTKSPSVIKYLGAGIVIGLLVGYGVAYARQRFDTRLRTVDDIDAHFDVPVLAVLPQSENIARMTAAEDEFHAAESLRKLRTNLRYANVDRQPRVILVTSPLKGDGKSSVAVNLAKVMALAGEEVVLVDTDMRRPSVAETYHLDGPLGLPQVLVGSVRADSVLCQTKVSGLVVLPTFDTPPNPSELLGSGRMAELVADLARDRVVVLDAPPVLPVTDAAVLSQLSDTVVMIASAGRTRAEQLDQALAAVEQGKGNVGGVVLNRVASSKLARLRYGDAEYGYASAATEYTRDERSSSPTAQKPEKLTGRLRRKPDVPAHRKPEELAETREMPVISASDESPHLADSSSLTADTASLSLSGGRRLRRIEREE